MDLSDKACDFCRKRKFKCTREKPRCFKCIQYTKSCSYSPRKRRCTLNKSHYQQLQNRIRILEKALSTVGKSEEEIKLLIQVVSDENSTQSSTVNDEKNEFDNLRNSIPRPIMKIMPNEENINTVSDDDSLLNEDFNGVEHLYWHESDSNSDNDSNEAINKSDSTGILPEKSFIITKGFIDGMGALSIDGEHKNSTYYGIFSSNGVLKILRKLDKQNNDITNFSNNSTRYSMYNQDSINLMKSQYSEILLNDNDFRMDLVRSYFETYHTMYPILQRSSFIKKFESFKGRSKEDLTSIKDISFQVLIDTVLAIGAFCKLGESSIIDLLYYKRVKLGLQRIDLMECACYHLLEACTLLGNYIQKRNKPNSSGNYFGLSFRMAISFGLHKEMNLSHKNSSSLKYFLMVERRRRLWWILYLFDVGHSITFGRPIHLPNFESINIGFPLNIEDSEVENLNGRITIGSFIKTYPTVYAGLTEEVKLSVISYNVYSCLTNLSKTNVDIRKRISELIELNSSIDEFISTLPYYFNENDELVERFLEKNCPLGWFIIKVDGTASIPKWFEFRRKKLIWKYKNLQILMFRNFIWETSNVFKDYENIKKYESDLKTKDLIDSTIRFCSNAARETIYSIKHFISQCELDTLSSWYATYYIFQAILVSILLLYKDIRCKFVQNIDTWLEEIEITKDALNQLQKHNGLASNLIDKINILTAPIIEILNKNSPQHNEIDLMNENSEEIFNFDFNNLTSTAASFFSNVGIDLDSAAEGIVMTNIDHTDFEDIMNQRDHVELQWDQVNDPSVENDSSESIL